jgi:magnesium transporter
MSEALLFREHEVEELDEWAGLVSELGSSTLLWIDCERPSDDEEIRRLAEELALDDESVRRLGAAETTPFLGDFGSYLHVTMYTPRGEERHLERVVCLVSESWIVTVRDGTVEVVEELRKRAEGSGEVGRLQGVDFLADLLTWVLEGYLRAFEAIEVELEEIDEGAMRGDALRRRTSASDTLRALVEMRAEVGRLRRSLAAHRGVLLALTRPELGGISTDESAERFESLLQRLGDVNQAGRDSRESIVGSFDVLMTQVGQRTNDVMKTLTIVSLLLLPGTLLAGILGMNFRVGLFDNANFFWVALAAMFAIAIATLIVVRDRHWI